MFYLILYIHGAMVAVINYILFHIHTHIDYIIHYPIPLILKGYVINSDIRYRISMISDTLLCKDVIIGNRYNIVSFKIMYYNVLLATHIVS